MAVFRRTDIGLRRSVMERAVTNSLRQAGDGPIAGATATWGSITGSLDDQSDLSQKFKDDEILRNFLDEY